jgi:hypothetical protein
MSIYYEMNSMASGDETQSRHRNISWGALVDNVRFSCETTMSGDGAPFTTYLQCLIRGVTSVPLVTMRGALY